MINPINLAFQLISKEKVPNNIKEDVLHTFDNFIYHLEKKSETWLLSFAMASIKIYMEVYKFTGKSISRILQLMGALLVIISSFVNILEKRGQKSGIIAELTSVILQEIKKEKENERLQKTN